MVILFEVPEERFGWVLSRIDLRVLGSQCPRTLGADAVIAAASLRRAGVVPVGWHILRGL